MEERKIKRTERRKREMVVRRAAVMASLIAIIMLLSVTHVSAMKDKAIETKRADAAEKQIKVLLAENAMVKAKKDIHIKNMEKALASALQEYSLIKYMKEKELFLADHNYNEFTPDQMKDALIKKDTVIAGLKDYYKKETGKEVADVVAVNFEVTMYTNAEGAYSKDNPNYGRTASGAFTAPGSVAAPRSIPFNSTVLVGDTKCYEVAGTDNLDVKDRGGAIVVSRGGKVRIDIWVDSLEEAKKYGRKQTEGFIITHKE